MIARGFRPVGWVAAVAAAALGCYMLSLNVAAERAELASVEREMVLAKRDIRALQTELGTRGRLQQLEHWNADVLALSAPASGQFLNDEFTLARYSEPQKSLDDSAKVRMASVDAVPAQPRIDRNLVPAPAALDKPVLRQASLVVGEAGPFTAVNAAPAKTPVVKQPVPKAPLVKVAEAEPAAAKAAAAKPAAPKVAEAKTAAAKASAKAPAVKVSVAKPAAASPAAKSPAKAAEKAAAKSAPKGPAKSTGLSDLAREIAQASKAEKSSGGAAGR
jgi:hypothetical protein